MCTLSWLQLANGYELFCNRDERHTRKTAAPPVIRETRGVRFIAPVDGDHGGTWLGVNESGVSLCLLNRYEGAPSSPGGVKANSPDDVKAEYDYRSRGLLLASLIDSLTVAHAHARLSGADLSCYRPFTLAVLSTNEPALLVHWSGGQKTFDGAGDDSVPLTSSSYRGAEVIASRQSLFRRMAEESGAVTPSLLRDFHRSHEPARGAYSICMHREDAATVSFSHVKVGVESIEFSYQTAPPCAGSRPVVVRLPSRREVLRAR
jgi:hypothetical protein